MGHPSRHVGKISWQSLTMLDYQASKLNVVVDALTWKPQLATLVKGKHWEEPTTQVTSVLRQRIKEGLENDPIAMNILKQLKEGKTKRFWVEDRFFYLGGHLYVL